MTSKETSGSILSLVLFLIGGLAVLVLATFVIFDVVDKIMLGIFGVFCYITPCDIVGIVTWYKALVLVFSFVCVVLLVYFFVKSGIMSVEVGESKDSSS